MEPFGKFTAIVAPLDRANVDTDAIIPKQFLKSIKRSGFGPNLFDEWRYLDQGQVGESCVGRPLNESFVLNLPRYQKTGILLARDNFGCGSSREHAPWALLDFGIKVVIAPSFADIFFNNCFKNGILPITLPADVVDGLFGECEAEEGFELSVDLEACTLTTPNGQVISFAVDEFRRYCLLNGLDDIGLTLKHVAEIESFEAKRRQSAPWAFLD
jgi:3-isopropylmalate/(R)-2-methylmalate dehydratase small subunit